MSDELIIKMSRKDLERLQRDLRAQARHMQERLESLEKGLFITAMTFKSDSEHADDSLKELSEGAGKMQSIKATLDPLLKKLAAVEGLLDPSISLWLAVQAGGADSIVEDFLAETFGDSAPCVEEKVVECEGIVGEVVQPPLEAVAEATEVAGQVPPPPPSRKKKPGKATSKKAADLKNLQDRLKKDKPSGWDNVGDM
jgi:hypothetical protein